MPERVLKLFITSNDIAKIENCSMRTASQKITDIKAFFKKIEKRHKITFKEYANYSGISYEDLDPFR